jgi:hypothetical protein
VCRSAESFDDELMQSKDPDAANYVPSDAESYVPNVSPFSPNGEPEEDPFS